VARVRTPGPGLCDELLRQGIASRCASIARRGEDVPIAPVPRRFTVIREPAPAGPRPRGPRSGVLRRGAPAVHWRHDRRAAAIPASFVASTVFPGEQPGDTPGGRRPVLRRTARVDRGRCCALRPRGGATLTTAARPARQGQIWLWLERDGKVQRSVRRSASSGERGRARPARNVPAGPVATADHQLQGS
jgi:hypothetical protein